MVNVSKPRLGFDANRGRRPVDRLLEELAFKLRQVGSSRPFLTFVAAAALVLGVYYFLIATPIYVSETSFSIRGREQSAASSMSGLLAGVAGASADSGTKEAAELSQYVLSEEMMSKLEPRFHLRQLYSRPRIDLLNWMRPGAHKEDFVHFYRKMVKVQVDRETNIVTVIVRSFDARSAHDIAEAILQLSAEYVDGLSATIRRDTVRSSEIEKQKAEAAVRQARLAMTQYRTSTGMLDPVMTAGATAGTITTLQQEILQTRAELATLLTYNTPNSPQAVQLKARIAALQGQIEETRHAVADTARKDNIAQRLYDYEGLLVANEYAEKQLVAALAAYDSALAVASQRERFLVRIVNPNLPDRPTEPRRLLSFLEVLLVVVAGYGIIALAIAGVRDHQGI